MKVIIVGKYKLGGANPLFLIAGPCVIESRDIAFQTAERLVKLTEKLGMPFIFKSSYLKDNRSSGNSYAGPGQEDGLRVLSDVKKEFGTPVLSDVHSVDEVENAAEVLDVLQIPAFLCRQTSLVVAAARTQRVVNIKKGQFMAPENMRWIVEKAVSAGTGKVMITERGASFGYNNLVVDMRSLLIMSEFGYPIVFDATHSVQKPAALGDKSGGDSKYALPLARAAVAVGCNGIFMETHPNPSAALSDSNTQIALDDAERFLQQVKGLNDFVRERLTKTL